MFQDVGLLSHKNSRVRFGTTRSTASEFRSGLRSWSGKLPKRQKCPASFFWTPFGDLVRRRFSGCPASLFGDIVRRPFFGSPSFRNRWRCHFGSSHFGSRPFWLKAILAQGEAQASGCSKAPFWRLPLTPSHLVLAPLPGSRDRLLPPVGFGRS